MTKDIFKDDNGVVHYHSDRKAHASQTDHIDIASEKRHQKKSPYHTDWDGKRYYQGTGEVSQKDQEYDDRQSPAYKDVFRHQVNGAIDVVCLIISLVDVQSAILQDTVVQFSKGLLYFLHNDQDVGTGFPNRIHHNSGDPLVPNNHLDIFIA